MEYKGLTVDLDEFGESYSGCHCTVFTSPDMEREIDDFYISPSELSENPDVEQWARVKLEERLARYAALGYIPACVAGGAR